jgi:hypothetical protein
MLFHGSVLMAVSFVPARVNDILHITQLITIFEVYDNGSDAIESF